MFCRPAQLRQLTLGGRVADAHRRGKGEGARLTATHLGGLSLKNLTEVEKKRMFKERQ